jgi:undecaprenyl-diphosphatase
VDLFKSIVLGIVEGVTEFLPVSSTGHLKLCEHWMGQLVNSEFASTFDIFIQIGAIAAVVVYFRDRILQLLTGKTRHESESTALPVPGFGGDEPPVQRHYVLMMIGLATLPLAIGYFLAKRTEGYLTQHPSAEALWIAAALGIGGVLMIVIELLRPIPKTTRMEAMTWKQSLTVGMCQILAAVFPGTSRSAATIMPGLLVGMSRQTAAEFSFFLAIPAMAAACGIKLLHFLHHSHATGKEWLLLIIGTLVSFLVAWIVIAAFMGYVRKHNFIPFGVYRIILCMVVLLVH